MSNLLRNVPFLLAAARAPRGRGGVVAGVGPAALSSTSPQERQGRLGGLVHPKHSEDVLGRIVPADQHRRALPFATESMRFPYALLPSLPSATQCLDRGGDVPVGRREADA